MPDEQLPINASTLDMQSTINELEVPFSPNQVQWRVTNTAKDRKRAQVLPYADPRAYADRLNALFTPQGWTREYRVETVNITRIKGGESIVTRKILVTCDGHDHRSLVAFRHRGRMGRRFERDDSGGRAGLQAGL